MLSCETVPTLRYVVSLQFVNDLNKDGIIIVLYFLYDSA